MNILGFFKARSRSVCFSVMAGLLVGIFFGPLALAQPSTVTNYPSSGTNAVVARTGSTNPVVPPKFQLTGAELYSINCNRCHPERAPTELTGAQWKTIMMQMRLRANLPGKQAKLILQYLQENSGR